MYTKRHCTASLCPIIPCPNYTRAYLLQKNQAPILTRWRVSYTTIPDRRVLQTKQNGYYPIKEQGDDDSNTTRSQMKKDQELDGDISCAILTSIFKEAQLIFASENRIFVISASLKNTSLRLLDTFLDINLHYHGTLHWQKQVVDYFNKVESYWDSNSPKETTDWRRTFQEAIGKL